MQSPVNLVDNKFAVVFFLKIKEVGQSYFREDDSFLIVGKVNGVTIKSVGQFLMKNVKGLLDGAFHDDISFFLILKDGVAYIWPVCFFENLLVDLLEDAHGTYGYHNWSLEPGLGIKSALAKFSNCFIEFIRNDVHEVDVGHVDSARS